jgi:hypothetical protein
MTYKKGTFGGDTELWKKHGAILTFPYGAFNCEQSALTRRMFCLKFSH